MALPPKRQRFVEEYLKDLNATQAAIRAGYAESGAGTEGERLLKNADVKAAVEAALAARSDRVQVTVDEVLREMKRIAMVDVGEAFTQEGALKPLADMDPDVRRSIASIEVAELYEGHGEERVRVGELRKVKFWDKKGALDSLAKHLGMYVERHQVEAGPSLEQLILAAHQVKK